MCEGFQRGQKIQKKDSQDRRVYVVEDTFGYRCWARADTGRLETFQLHDVTDYRPRAG